MSNRRRTREARLRRQMNSTTNQPLSQYRAMKKLEQLEVNQINQMSEAYQAMKDQGEFEND